MNCELLGWFLSLSREKMIRIICENLPLWAHIYCIASNSRFFSTKKKLIYSLPFHLNLILLLLWLIFFTKSNDAIQCERTVDVCLNLRKSIHRQRKFVKPQCKLAFNRTRMSEKCNRMFVFLFECVYLYLCLCGATSN